MTSPETFDVVVAGGGLAGQTLARQLRLTLPDLSVALIDAEKRPLPEAAFKVGEATAELSAHYFAEDLQLKAHLERDHLVKCGLRFFFGDAHGPLAARPEYGPRTFPPVTSYQLDRGRLENYLREANAAAGVSLFEGFGVEDIMLGGGDRGHTTVIRERGGNGATRTLQSPWVVDCTGRQRLLQRKLQLERPSPIRHSAAWFRVMGRCDIADLAAPDAADWHTRVPDGARYHSTNHLMGEGYWVWLIPLGSGHTSVGIVVDEQLHPVAGIDGLGKAMRWLEAREPALARHLAAFPVLDFRAFKEFSYATRQFYAIDRWACSGEAAMFTDPFYSPGSDFIALGNTIITTLIDHDRRRGLTSELVDRYNGLMLLFQRAFTEVFRDLYPMFGKSRVMTAKVVWDNASYWAFVCPVLFQDLLTKPETLDRYGALFERFYQLNLRVQQLFRDWGRQTRDPRGYGYLGYADFAIAVRNHLDLPIRKSPARILDEIEQNLDRFAAWAQVLFEIAVEDAAPDLSPRLPIDSLTLEQLDLTRVATLRSEPQSPLQTPRSPWAADLFSLRRQMTKLFPEYRCLHT